MKTFNGKVVYQGDIAIERVEKKLPEGCNEIQPRARQLIIAHSETGHHHFVAASEARFYSTLDPLVCYLTVSEKYADLVHNRPGTAHETWRLPAGTYKIRRQREWTPEGWRRVED